MSRVLNHGNVMLHQPERRYTLNEQTITELAPDGDVYRLEIGAESRTLTAAGAAVVKAKRTSGRHWLYALRLTAPGKLAGGGGAALKLEPGEYYIALDAPEVAA